MAKPAPVEDATFDKMVLKASRPVLVDFWATWCIPCVKELPYFEEARTVFKDQPVRIVLISLDFKKQIQSRLLPFLEKNHVASEVRVLDAPDANEWIDRVDPSWGGAIPATLVYRGNRRAFHEDAFTREELIALVQSFLEPSP